ncbi:hypothetical protein RI129_005176 [Pyrocoelia pectoralis]|uniref:Protein DP71L n=1 Tax=Pyrocoelia pectoralis TaxID=417401 RepID=A0AAN7ZK28_9COLE
MYNIKAGFTEPEFAHIVSFRRSVYIESLDDKPLPTSIAVTFEEDTYRIFLQDDEIKCFRCNEIGHTTSKCNAQGKYVLKEVDTETLRTNKRNRESTVTSPPDTPNTDNNEGENHFFQPNKNKTTMETDTMDKMVTLGYIPKERSSPPKKKKQKPSTESTLTEMELLLPLKDHINKNEYQFSFDQFYEFYKNVKVAENPLETAQQFMSDIDRLLATLRDLYPLLLHQRAKYRFTRIINNIHKQQRKQLHEEVSQTAEESQSTESEAMKKVTFDESQNRVYIMVVWPFAYEEARKGPWETIALDRYRFSRKIEEFNRLLSPVLQEKHRAKIYRNISSQGHDV